MFLFFFSNSRGKVIKPLQYQSTVAPGTVARVEPNIKWFGKYIYPRYILGEINSNNAGKEMVWLRSVWTKSLVSYATS